MASVGVTFTFAEKGLTPSSQINTNFSDLVNFFNTNLLVNNYTALSASDVTGPTGSSLLVFVRDSTNGGNALALYETGQTPVIVSNIVGLGTTFVGGAPGLNQIGIKDGTGKILFRANGTTNNAVLKTWTLIIA